MVDLKRILSNFYFMIFSILRQCSQSVLEIGMENFNENCFWGFGLFTTYVIIKTLLGGIEKSMGTRIRRLGQMQIEQQELDETGLKAQRELNDLVMQEYERTGTLTGSQLSEAVTEYEESIKSHVVAAEQTKQH